MSDTDLISPCVTSLVEQLEAQQAGKSSHTPITMPVLPPKTSSQELLEAEVKELKATLATLEKEYKKDKENLNSEVLQLELLIEAKIFREGELESQLEDVRRALTESKRSSIAAVTRNLANGDSLPPLKNHDSPRKGKSTVKPDRGSVSSIASHSSGNYNEKEEGENVPPGRRSASQYSEEDYDDGLCEICKEDHAVEVSAGLASKGPVPLRVEANKRPLLGFAELPHIRRIRCTGYRPSQEQEESELEWRE